MKLGQKVESRSSIRSEDHHDFGRKIPKSEDLFFFFFREHHDFGRKKGNTRSESYFFLENIKFWKFLPQAPNFEYPPLS